MVNEDLKIMNSRKSAFTLAETIMTLFIVGVVISASIPVFTSKQQKITSDFCSDATNIETTCSSNPNEAICKKCLPWNSVFAITDPNDSTKKTNNSIPGLYTNEPIVIGGNTPLPISGPPYYNLTFYKNADNTNTSIYDIFKSNNRSIGVGSYYFIETKPDLTNGSGTPLTSSATNLYVTNNKDISLQPNTRANVTIGAGNTINNYTTDNIIIGTGNTINAGDAIYDVISGGTFKGPTRNNTIIGSNNKIGSKVKNTLVFGQKNYVTQSYAVVVGNNNNLLSGKLVIGSNATLNYPFNIGNFIFGDASSITFGPGDGSTTEDPILGTKIPNKADLEVYTFNSPGIDTTSDERLKNIKGSYDKGLKEILQVQPVTFAYKNDPSQEIHAGVIAQDIQKILPEAVDKMPSGYLGVNQDPMFFAVLNALKEINEKTIEEEKKHEQLEKELNTLVAEIENLNQCKNAGFWGKILCKISSLKREIVLWLPVNNNSEVKNETA